MTILFILGRPCIHWKPVLSLKHNSVSRDEYMNTIYAIHVSLICPQRIHSSLANKYSHLTIWINVFCYHWTHMEWTCWPGVVHTLLKSVKVTSYIDLSRVLKVTSYIELGRVVKVTSYIELSRVVNHIV